MEYWTCIGQNEIIKGVFNKGLYIALGAWPIIQIISPIKLARRIVLSAFFGAEITPTLYLHVWFFILRVILEMFIRRKKGKS